MDDDRWKVYTAGVKALPKRAVKKAEKKPVVKQQKSKEEIVIPPLPKTKAEPWSLDRRAERKLRQGNREIEARLDLHGKTESAAHEALVRFVEHNALLGHATLLVITGKGREGKSVLRANFPRWCETERLAKIIKMVYPAALKHGGDGAFYLLLRKTKG